MPQECSTLSAGYFRTSECGVASGIKKLWIANYSSASVWSANTTGEIVSGSTGVPTFYPVEIRQGTCSFGEEIVANEQWGSKSIRATFDLAIIGQGQSGRTFVNQLLGSRVVLAVETEQGVKILAGEDAPLEMNGGRGSAGVQAGEENTIHAVISGLQNEFCATINSTYAGYLLPTS